MLDVSRCSQPVPSEIVSTAKPFEAKSSREGVVTVEWSKVEGLVGRMRMFGVQFALKTLGFLSIGRRETHSALSST
jgi:hypothetical protein